jgi:peptide/nickel transport system permease protein
MLVKRPPPPMWEGRGLRQHPLGTDHLGGDILSRILEGMTAGRPSASNIA